MTFDPSFSSASSSEDQLIAGHKPPAKAVPATILDGETITRGMLLGQVTASGKFVESLAAATDGSQTPRAIASEALAPSGADEVTLIYVEGEFNEHEISFGTGHTAANTRQGLWDYNIYIVDPVTKTPA